MSAVSPNEQVQPGLQARAAAASTNVSQVIITIFSRVILAVLVVAALAALVIGLLLWQKVSSMQEQLARQSADALTQAAGAGALARQASETVQEAVARITLMQTKLDELSAQRMQVDELLQNFSRSRDQHLLVELESMLRFAQQQTEGTGNAAPLLSALKFAEQRVARAAQPRLARLQRAIQRDADRIRSSASSDDGQSLQRLDELIRSIDDLPILNSVDAFSDGGNLLQPETLLAQSPWWERALWLVRKEARSLLRVGRIDHPEALLLAPEQSYFLRENLKLTLLNARLALLSRQIDVARKDLGTVTTGLSRYFDSASRQTQAAVALLRQLQAQIQNVEPPRIDDTLAALATAAAEH